MFSKAKIGDRVWSINKGWATVIDVDIEDQDYPIRIKYDQGYTEWITGCGKVMMDHLSPTVFWDEIKIVPPTQPLPELAVDTLVLVRDEGEDWQPAHFAGWHGTSIRVWVGGRTSHTSYASITYDEWRLPEDD